MPACGPCLAVVSLEHLRRHYDVKFAPPHNQWPLDKQGEKKDLLFMLTERYKFCVLEYDASTGAC